MIFLAEITSQSITFLLLGVLAMIILSVSLVVFFVVYQRRMFAQQQEQLIMERKHQRELLSAAIAIQETERRRIASDLHDGIGSLLSATRLYLRQLKPGIDVEKAEGIKASALEIVDEVIHNTRRITHDLLPPVLEKFGFFPAAEDLCEKINGSGGIAINFGIVEGDRMKNEQSIALYRILQELINNTLKHAAAAAIDVSGGWESEKYHFSYRDDGKGFDLNENASAGLGLRNIESRVTLLNGELNWDTSPGNGIVVNIYIPV